MHLKISSAKWRQFSPKEDELNMVAAGVLAMIFVPHRHWVIRNGFDDRAIDLIDLSIEWLIDWLILKPFRNDKDDSRPYMKLVKINLLEIISRIS